MKFDISNSPTAAFSYASLTDMVLLLLIFFLLSSQFIVQTGVKVKLPGSKTEEVSDPTLLVVTITSTGSIFTGTAETGIEQLAQKLTELKGTSDQSSLIIRADKTVQIDLVIKVIDAAKSIGIGKFTIETEKEK